MKYFWGNLRKQNIGLVFLKLWEICKSVTANNTQMLLRSEVRVVWWIINTDLDERKYIQNFHSFLNLIKNNLFEVGRSGMIYYISV